MSRHALVACCWLLSALSSMLGTGTNTFAKKLKPDGASKRKREAAGGEQRGGGETLRGFVGLATKLR